MFDFNKIPLDPLSCKTFIRENMDARRTWAPHGAVRWYIGPATDHYRYHHVYMKSIRAELVGGTVYFFPYHTRSLLYLLISASIWIMHI